MLINEIYSAFNQVLSRMRPLKTHAFRTLHLVFLTTFLLLSAQMSIAAEDLPAPDAGQILRQIERDLEVKPLPALPELPSQAPVIEETQAELVLIKHFKFTGNHVLAEDELAGALAPLTNRSILLTRV